jgi:ABC-2 type transport system permease protein
MSTELLYTLIRLRWQIIGWGLAIASLGLIIVAFYDVFLEQQEGFLRMIESYPPEFLAFFGGDVTILSTPEGYLGMYGFSMLPVIIGIFAVIAGSGLIAGDEEGGQLDLILAHPLSRTTFFFGRLLALTIATTMIVLLGWLGFSVLLGGSSLDIPAGTMALPFLPLLVQALTYSAIALLLSMLLPARRMAALGAALVMVTSYLLSSLSSLNEGLAFIAQFLPYAYFQGSDALSGLNLGWLFGLLMVAVLLSLLAWWRFLRRDIRVAGEGRWTLMLRRAA